jgi:hypothetical protein
MARQSTTMDHQAVKTTQKKKSRSATSSLKTLQRVRKEKVKEFTTVKNTDNAYNGYVARGMEFLKDVVKERLENGEDSESMEIPTDKLAKAFDKPPNKYSTVALEMYLVQKCFTEGLGTSTADGIHGAFAAYWDTMSVQSHNLPHFELLTKFWTGIMISILGYIHMTRRRTKSMDVQPGPWQLGPLCKQSKHAHI